MENDELAANPADEVVTLPNPHATAEPETEAAPETNDDLDALTREALGESPDEAKPEYVEVEIDGKRYKVLSADGEPVDPELKFGALRDADYRKKTMTLAEERKALQQEREAYQARVNLEGEAALRARNLTAVDAEIRELSQVNIDDLRAAGWTEEQIVEASENLRALAAQRDELARQVQHDAQRFSEMERAEFTQAREKAIRQAALEDKALTPERIEQLERFAIENGVPEQDARTITDPTVYKMLHLADIGKKFVERQRKAANMKAAAAGTPAKTLGGIQAGGKDPASMSMEEYMQWRAAGNG